MAKLRSHEITASVRTYDLYPLLRADQSLAVGHYWLLMLMIDDDELQYLRSGDEYWIL